MNEVNIQARGIGSDEELIATMFDVIHESTQQSALINQQSVSSDHVRGTQVLQFPFQSRVGPVPG